MIGLFFFLNHNSIIAIVARNIGDPRLISLVQVNILLSKQIKQGISVHGICRPD